MAVARPGRASAGDGMDGDFRFIVNIDQPPLPERQGFGSNL
jgi:hypothetical protein